MFNSNSRLFACCLGLGLSVVGCALPNLQLSNDQNSGSNRSWSPWGRTQMRYRETGEDEIIPEVKDPSTIQVSYARWMSELGQFEVSRGQYQEVLAKNPKHIGAIVGMASCDQAMGHLPEAEQGFHKAVQTDPQSALAHQGLGQFLISQNRIAEGVDELNRAVTAAPYDRDVRFQLAIALAKTGQIDASIPHFTQAVGDAEGHYNVALILKDAKDLDGAEEHLQIALTKNPNLKDADRWLTLIQEAQHSGEADIVQVSAEEVKKAKPVYYSYDESKELALSEKEMVSFRKHANKQSSTHDNQSTGATQSNQPAAGNRDR